MGTIAFIRGFPMCGIIGIVGKDAVSKLAAEPLEGVVGIAHTRWATHGAPTEDNAHPHIVGDVTIVHNGIIENFKPLRDELIAEGRIFLSETDTEVVAHLVDRKITSAQMRWRLRR